MYHRLSATTRIAVLFAVMTFAHVSTSSAQFSQAVIVMKGSIRTEEGARPTSVKVSVRAINDTASEITSSRSNSETGKYLVILKPGKKYWIHIEGDTVITKDVMIETPNADQTRQMEQDLTVTAREYDPKPVGVGAAPASSATN
jgi:hypothetical protein